MYTESRKPIPDVEESGSQKGVELSKTPIELKSGEWVLKVVPWIGGRILSMEHLPSGTLYPLFRPPKPEKKNNLVT